MLTVLFPFSDSKFVLVVSEGLLAFSHGSVDVESPECVALDYSIRVFPLPIGGDSMLG